jgi:hypothetical protein
MLAALAAADDEHPDPQLLRKLIPHKKAFLRFLKERGLLDDADAKFILSVLESDASKNGLTKVKTNASESGLASVGGIVLGVVSEVAGNTGFEKEAVRTIVEELALILSREPKKSTNFINAVLLGINSRKKAHDLVTRIRDRKGSAVIKSKTREQVK